MNVLKIYLVLVFLLIIFPIKSQEYDFKFSSPLDIPMFLSGNFGEIRLDHFHTGIDIKTQGVIGKTVYAVADGYISRIKIQANGYGKALYITHDNGYTSVYCHLDHFRDDIRLFVENEQYKKRTFETDIYLDKSTFKIKEGDSIAVSGNSGGSGGPHLHFEIRDQYQQPLNVLRYNIKINDNIKPIFRNIKVYPVEGGQVNESFNELKIEAYKANGNYKVIKPVIEVNGKIGFAVEVYDYLNGVSNRCGIYKLELLLDSSLINQFSINKLSFNELRYVNAHIDYYEKKINNANFQKLYKLPNNKLDIYRFTNDGTLEINDTLKHAVKIIAFDAYGNSSELNFYIKGIERQLLIDSVKNYNSAKLMKYNERNTFILNDIKIDIPAYSLYENLYFNYIKTNDTESDFPVIYHIHNKYVPVQKYFSLAIKPDSFAEGLENKTFIALIDEDGLPEYIGGEYKNGFIYTTTRDFGKYILLTDTIMPEIKPINFVNGSKIENNNSLVIFIKDNLSEIKDYNGYIDDKWVLFDYDKKNDIIIHTLDEKRYPKNQWHNLKLVVSDNMNNLKEANYRFFW